MQPSRRRLQAFLGALALLLVASVALYLVGVRAAAVLLMVEIVGGLLFLLAIPLYLLPELERRFERRLPNQIGRVRDGVLFFRYGPAIATLASELEQAKLDPIFLETDESVGPRPGGARPAGGVREPGAAPARGPRPRTPCARSSPTAATTRTRR